METIWLDEVDSTNSEILRRASGLANLSVVAAGRQTAGRGQRGNTWSSEASQNLTFSILLRPGMDGVRAIPAVRQFVVSEIAALSVVDYLHLKGIEARIKWPNDIYCGERKICGILIENTLCGEDILSSVIGIGINVNQREFPADLPNPVSMNVLTGREFVLDDELEIFLSLFEKRLSVPEETLREDYLEKMYLKDEPHSFTDTSTGEVFTGTIRGISPTACLVVELQDGSLREFAFKEIGYLPTS